VFEVLALRLSIAGLVFGIFRAWHVAILGVFGLCVCLVQPVWVCTMRYKVIQGVHTAIQLVLILPLLANTQALEAAAAFKAAGAND